MQVTLFFNYLLIASSECWRDFLSCCELVCGQYNAVYHKGDDWEEDEQAGHHQTEYEGGAYGKAADDDGGGFAEGSIFVFHGANV